MTIQTNQGEWVCNCHNKPVNIYSGEEGTNSWECSVTKETCDAHKTQTNQGDTPTNLQREKKMSAFNKTFNEPVYYAEDNEYYLSSELYNKEQALEVFRKYFAEGYDRYIKTFTIDDIYDDRVRWCCQYDYDEGVGRCAWWSGATGKGSKPCWFIKLRYKEKSL